MTIVSDEEATARGAQLKGGQLFVDKVTRAIKQFREKNRDGQAADAAIGAHLTAIAYEASGLPSDQFMLAVQSVVDEYEETQTAH